MPRAAAIMLGQHLIPRPITVRDILRFVGIEDVRFVYAEGLNMGEASKEKGLAGRSEGKWKA
ncbi:hypothetical protein ACTMU2_17545 [Cupriavidus basilensis]